MVIKVNFLLFYINSILDYGYILKRSLKLKIEIFPVKLAIEEIISLLKLEFDNKGIDVILNLAEDIKEIEISNDK